MNNTQVQSSISKFIPLIVIFSVIILFTAFRVISFGEWDTVFAMRNFMGAFFIVFGGFKVIKWGGFVEAYQMYDVIAKRSKVYAYLYPLIELALGIAYLTGFQLLAINWITLFVMLVSSIGVAKELLKGEEIVCACLGAVFKIPMTKVTLIEDLLMAGMALSMIIWF